MPDISIRKFTDEQYALIKARAVQEGQSMEAWVKDLILQAAINPPASLSPEARKAWIKQKARRMQAAVEMREAEAEMQRIETELFQAAEFMVGTAENEKDIAYIYTKEEYSEYEADSDRLPIPDDVTWEHVKVESSVHMDWWIEQKKRWLEAAWTSSQTNEERRENARIMRNAEQTMRSLEIHHCEYVEDGEQCCLRSAIYCDSGSCAPGQFYCAYHYGEVHGPILHADEGE